MVDIDLQLSRKQSQILSLEERPHWMAFLSYKSRLLSADPTKELEQKLYISLLEKNKNWYSTWEYYFECIFFFSRKIIPWEPQLC